MNYKEIKFDENLEHDVIFASNINEYDQVDDKNQIKFTVSSKVSQLSIYNINILFQQIQKSETFPELYSNFDKFYLHVKRNSIPYFRSFHDLEINHKIVNFLKEKNIKSKILILHIIASLLYYSPDQYFNDLNESNFISPLIELFTEESELYLLLIEIYTYISKKSQELKNQILKVVDINLIFSKLGNDSISEEEKKYYFDFLVSVLYWYDFDFEFVQIYLDHAKLFLQGWKSNIWLPLQLFLIIVDYICDFQKYADKEIYPIFQSYVRESQIIDLALSFLMENEEFIQKQQDIEYRNSLQKEFDKDGSQFSVNKILNLIITLIQFSSFVFEMPVDFKVNLQFFCFLANNNEKLIRIQSIFSIGNLFESMPETIFEMASLGFFDLLKNYIDDADNETKIESLTCCATAICFSDYTTRIYFAHNDYLSFLMESIPSLDNKSLSYMIIDSVTWLIETIVIESGPRYALELFDDERDNLSMFEVSSETDQKVNQALTRLKNKIDEIEKIVGE